jgi:hypothetical protein
MGEWSYGSTNFWRQHCLEVQFHAVLPLGKLYPLYSGLYRPQSIFGRREEEKNLLDLPIIEHWLLGLVTHSLVATPTELSWIRLNFWGGSTHSVEHTINTERIYAKTRNLRHIARFIYEYMVYSVGTPYQIPAHHQTCTALKNVSLGLTYRGIT